MNNESTNLLTDLRNCFDSENQIIETKFTINEEEFSIFYIESLIDKKLFASSILAPIEKLDDNDIEQNQNLFELVKSIISVSSMEEINELEKIKNKILSGQVIVLFKDNSLCCPLYAPEKRGVQEPPSSKVVKGPREGFVEDIYTNMGLIRKRLKTSDLKIIDIYIGEKTKTQVSVFYIKDVAKPDIVNSIVKSLKSINIDAIIDSYYIESFLEGENIKFFKRLGNTEKPDIFSAKILEGRVGILVDGSPMALTAPFVLLEDLQSAGDYYTIPAIATFKRIMRIFGLIVAILAPGVYVALQSYNYRILPINFLITILSSIEGLSIPPLLEILVVIFLFEVITEASLRMPDPLSMALSIIGALALGNTAVDAGIISPPSIVVVAVSSVALYIIPDQTAETRILRLIITAIGGVIGLYGIFVSIIILTTYLCSIESFGVPYLAPYAPSIKQDKKDGFIKRTIQDMKNRPYMFAGEDKIRQGTQSSDNENSNINQESSNQENQEETEQNAEKSKENLCINLDSKNEENSSENDNSNQNKNCKTEGEKLENQEKSSQNSDFCAKNDANSNNQVQINQSSENVNNNKDCCENKNGTNNKDETNKVSEKDSKTTFGGNEQ